MSSLHYPAYFFGAALLANAIPHLVSGMMGRAFQSPFATPSGVGLSSSKVNVLWGFANLVLAYFLLIRVGNLDLRMADQALVAGAGFLLMSYVSAHLFGRFHGGQRPEA